MWAIASDAEAGCDARSPCPGRRLAHARVEPGNAVAWIPAFPDAGEKASEAAVEGVLEKMAAADRADDHSSRAFARRTTLVRRPLAARVQTRTLPVPRARRTGSAGGGCRGGRGDGGKQLGGAAAESLPEQEQVQAPARRFELCAQAGRGFMRNGTSFMDGKPGLRAGAELPGGYGGGRLERRRSQWRQQAMADLASVFDKPQEADLYFTDLLATGVEARGGGNC
jgi:hypothetical protein